MTDPHVPDCVVDFAYELSDMLIDVSDNLVTEDHKEILAAFYRRVDDLALSDFSMKRVRLGVSSLRPAEVGFFEALDDGSVWTFWTEGLHQVLFDVAKRDVSIEPPTIPLALKPELAVSLRDALVQCSSADAATDATQATLATFAEAYALAGLGAAAQDASVEDALFQQFRSGWSFRQVRPARRREQLELLFVLFESFGVRWLKTVPDDTFQIMTSQATKRYGVRTRFELGDRLEHPTFGKGVVIEAVDAQVSIQFFDQVRRLAHARD